jgi:hypothetical protein
MSRTKWQALPMPPETSVPLRFFNSLRTLVKNSMPSGNCCRSDYPRVLLTPLDPVLSFLYHT